MHLVYDRIIRSLNLSIKGALSGLRQFLASESPLKKMKDAFYFTWKVLFVLRIFKFLFLLFVFTIHIFTNISRTKGNQATKFGQLIEHNIQNIFLEKSYIKCIRETISRHFSKKSKLIISLNQYCKVLYISS